MHLSYNHRYLSGLSWLRFGLALYLILFHTIRNYSELPAWIISITSAGFVSTSMFFIVSGYVLTYVYYDEQGELRTTRVKFLAERFFTLYPLHLFGFLLSAIIIFVHYKFTGNIYAIADIPPHLQLINQEPLHVALTAPEVALNVIANLLLVHAWNPMYLTFNIPSWSISALIFFYIVFVFSGKLNANIKNPFKILLIINFIYLLPPIFFIIVGEYNSVTTGILHTNPLIRFPEFLSGIILCTWMRSVELIKLTINYFLIAFATLMMMHIALLYGMLNIGPAGFYLVHNGVLLSIQLAIIALFVKMPDIPIEWLNKLIDRIGNATLSIFVLHLPLFYFISHFEKLIKLILNFHTNESIPEQVKGIELSLIFYPIIILLIVLICVVVQEHFVLKIRRPLRKFFLKI